MARPFGNTPEELEFWEAVRRLDDRVGHLLLQNEYFDPYQDPQAEPAHPNETAAARQHREDVVEFFSLAEEHREQAERNWMFACDDRYLAYIAHTIMNPNIPWHRMQMEEDNVAAFLDSLD